MFSKLLLGDIVSGLIKLYISPFPVFIQLRASQSHIKGRVGKLGDSPPRCLGGVVEGELQAECLTELHVCMLVLGKAFAKQAEPCWCPDLSPLDELSLLSPHSLLIFLQ